MDQLANVIFGGISSADSCGNGHGYECTHPDEEIVGGASNGLVNVETNQKSSAHNDEAHDLEKKVPVAEPPACFQHHTEDHGGPNLEEGDGHDFERLIVQVVEEVAWIDHMEVASPFQAGGLRFFASGSFVGVIGVEKIEGTFGVVPGFPECLVDWVTVDGFLGGDSGWFLDQPGFIQRV